MPSNPSFGRPNQPYVSPKLNAMLIKSTTIIVIAGESVSPAPRRQALAVNITRVNGRANARMRRYS
jgi:hypothetical protein